MQVIMDVVRTLEVLVPGSIPKSAISDQISSEKFNENYTQVRRAPQNIENLKEEYDKKIEEKQKVTAEEVLETTWNSYYPPSAF